MYCYLLQDWITIRGVSAVTVLTQPEPEWINASFFQDAVAWVDVKETSFSSGAPTLALQTAAVKDDVFFVNMGSQSFSAPGTSVIVTLKETATTPLSTWLRWQLQVSSGATWDVT